MTLQISRERLRSLVADEGDSCVTAGAITLSPIPSNQILAALPDNVFPVTELVRRRWINVSREEVLHDRMRYLTEFFSKAATPQVQSALLRHTPIRDNTQSEREQRRIAATALWVARIEMRSREEIGQLQPYRGGLTADLLRETAKLSADPMGPALVRDFLGKHGIAFVVEQHLPSSRLDGAALINGAGVPVVALTLRYDRIDNFWFTLLHELGHIVLHLQNDAHLSFLDDLDETATNELEHEANMVAANALIPRQVWNRSEVRQRPTERGIVELSEKLEIHPAVIAGRIQRERNRYDILRDMVGDGEIRRLFFS